MNNMNMSRLHILIADDLKTAAHRQAKSEGHTLTFVVVALLAAYVEGKVVVLPPHPSVRVTK